MFDREGIIIRVWHVEFNIRQMKLNLGVENRKQTLVILVCVRGEDVRWVSC